MVKLDTYTIDLASTCASESLGWSIKFSNETDVFHWLDFVAEAIELHQMKPDFAYATRSANFARRLRTLYLGSIEETRSAIDDLRSILRATDEWAIVLAAAINRGTHDYDSKRLADARYAAAFKKSRTQSKTGASNMKQNTIADAFQAAKDATIHGAKVAAADEAANLMLELSSVVLPESVVVVMSASEQGRAGLKYATALAVLSLLDSGALPIEQTHVGGVRAACILVIEASTRDGVQPILAKATPILVRLATTGMRFAAPGR